MREMSYDQTSLEAMLSVLPLGQIRYFASASSTNTLAAGWAESSAPDLSLVIADEQTAGRGRQGRSWFTPAGAALAFSLILRAPLATSLRQPDPQAISNLVIRHTALGALAVCDALESLYGLSAQIKWPNDVLLERKKFCGILAEAHWHGSDLQAIILGIGVNVFPASVPPENETIYPATCIQQYTQATLERNVLLKEILTRTISWRTQLHQPEFIAAWQNRLAFQGEWISLCLDPATPSEAHLAGRMIGLDAEGRLVIEDKSGAKSTIQYGELRLRPFARS